MGKKGLYEEWLREENLEVLRGWARNGLYMEQIAKNIGISRKTLNEWMKKYQQIGTALKENKEKADLIIENEMFKRAQGYTAKVVKHYKVKRTEYEDGKRVAEVEELIPVKDEVHIPADVKAQTFWLQHRKPENWGKIEEDPERNKDEKAVIEIPATIEINDEVAVEE